MNIGFPILLCNLLLNLLADGAFFAKEPPRPNRQINEIVLGLERNSALGFQGSVLVACDKEVILHQHFGVPEHKAKLVRYQIASITKWLTAIAVLKLIEGGVIDFGTSMDRFWSTLPPEKASITIHHLLTHRSGIRQGYAAEGHSRIDKAASTIFKAPLIHTPGSVFTYSNDNYSLLAMIIDKIADQGYVEYMNQVIMEPLELGQVSFWPESVHSTEYVPPLIDPPGRPRGARVDWGYRGATGARLSVEELFQVYRGVIEGRVLSPSSVKALFTPTVTLSNDTGVAFGWFVEQDQYGQDLGSTRGYETSGANAVLYTSEATGLTFVVATHAGPDERAGPGWSRVIRDLILETMVYDEHEHHACGPF